MIQQNYISKNHSKFLRKYHVILVCKYRKKLLLGAIEYDMKRILQNISDMSNFDIEEYLFHIFYRERTFWTDGYFIASVGNVSQETIRRYIENQG